MATELNFKGLPLVVEYRKGETKPPSDPSGPMSVGWPMYADYGYIKDTVSPEEAEELDFYLGEDRDSDRVFYASIYKVDRESEGEQTVFDEFKILLGFKDLKAAKDHMYNQYSQSMTGPIIESSIEDLKETVALSREKNRKEKIFVKKDVDNNRYATTKELSQYGQSTKKIPQLVIRN